MSHNGYFTFTWTIENPYLCPLENGEYIESPRILLKQFHNTEWCLQLYPRGRTKECQDDVSLFLYRCRDEGPEEVGIQVMFTYNIRSPAPIKYSYSLKKGHSGGCHEFCTRSDFEEGRDILIVCHMQMASSSTVKSTDFQNRILDSCLMKPSFPNEIMEETYSVITKRVNETIEEFLPNFNQAFAFSRIFVENKVFTCDIKDYLLTQSTQQQRISIEFSSFILLIVLSVDRTGDNDFLGIQFVTENKIISNCVLNCRVDYVNSDMKMIDYTDEKHLYCSNHLIKKWNLKYPKNLSYVKKYNVTGLRFILECSNGEYFSDIQKTSELDDSIGLINMPNDVSKDLHRLFTEKRFCDLTVRVGDDAIPAHKTVLCSRSLVFAAMFESNLKENQTNVIEIVELESDIVNQMLQFMYTGIIEELDAEKAMKLYVAADKYQILSLKDICGSFLRRNLTIQNICSVLLLADRHLDEQLSACVISFVSRHRSPILKSKEWEEFRGNNTCLALDTLTKICLKMFP